LKPYQGANPREGAFLALLSFYKTGAFLSDTLGRWQAKAKPTPLNFRLAKHLALGALKMRRSLNFFLKDRCSKLKVKERCLLHLALYQAFFSQKIPSYALVNEMVSLAKKYCHHRFASFLNAFLRKLPSMTFDLPDGDDADSLGICYSYPTFFVQSLLYEVGLQKTRHILEAGNAPPHVFFRKRFPEKPCPFPCQDVTSSCALFQGDSIQDLVNSCEYYIQNVTPVSLLDHMRSQSKPKRILDLCSAPGGKLLYLFDAYPKAKLFANDVSEKRLETLRANCEKYAILADISNMPGEEFSSKEPFDLILLDVPCSNSGVLSKRAEARWRLDEDNVKELEEKQKRLLKHALSLLAPGGEIWYLTCSILQCENEKIAEFASDTLGMQRRTSHTIFPKITGEDGGFGVVLTRKFS